MKNLASGNSRRETRDAGPCPLLSATINPGRETRDAGHETTVLLSALCFQLFALCYSQPETRDSGLLALYSRPLKYFDQHLIHQI
jgi:hypothetical protein